MSTPEGTPPPSTTVRVALSRLQVIALAFGLAVLLGAAIGITLLVGGEKHAGAAGAHDDHEDHDDHDDGHKGHGHAGHDDEPKGHAHGGEHDEQDENRVKLSPAALAKAGIETRVAGPGKVAVTLSLPGELSVNADAVAHVSPRVGGAVRTVLKRLGDVVKKGEVLATVDSRELADLQQAFASAKARLDLAKASFKREEQLWNEKIAAEKDYLAAKQAVAEAEIDVRTAARKLNAAGAAGGSGSYTLVAPLDGTIIEKHISIGEVVRDDTQAFVIADLSTLWVQVTVYAKDLARVHIGQRVTVRAEGIAEGATGTIDYVGHVVGEDTRSATARVVLASPGLAWRPGLIVTALVAVEEVDAAVVVPDEAIQTVGGASVVFVKENDAFEARRVVLGKVGGADPDRVVEIASGLAAGDVFVAKNSFLLKAELGKSEAGHEH